MTIMQLNEYTSELKPFLKPAKPRRVYRTAQIKPETRNALMDVLAHAANALIDKQAEAEGWRELAEREPEEATPFPALTLVAIGAAIGFALGMGLAWGIA